VVLEPQQGRELLLIQLLDPDTDLVSKHEVQKRLLLAVEVGADDGFSPAGPFFAVKWRQSVSNVREHVEEIALLGVDYLLHLAQLFMAKALLGKALEKLFPRIGDAPQRT
jgi:hypothetical protein